MTRKSGGAKERLSDSEYEERFIQNRQKGDVYIVKFHGDSTVYRGIPIIESSAAFKEPLSFDFRVLSPEDEAGVQKRLVSNIEYAHTTA